MDDRTPEAGSDSSTRAGGGRLLLAVVAWVLAIATGLGGLMWYGRSGAGSGEPDQATAITPAARHPPRATVTVFAHPKCPCTRATLVVLERVAAIAGPQVEIEVKFYRPDGKADSWAWTESWRSAGQIPGVRVMTDPGGREAALAGAWTSGHVVVRDHEGTVVFSGGITDARSDGSFGVAASAMLACVRGERSDTHTPVFGCAIQTAPIAAVGGSGP